eukprot:NODE_6435_length_535_cov_20.269608_g6270_i0.p2 GENE.NODE_6435_length_535_cov_20.269608_g6270_i0~~NODE_6435_length_535_cov_20.269608_g6270_i0.p2  ORF type:complete len:162 (+),score=61.31 NODE_6435_length_535_cov_20.269608_g6270_i0:53-487(+)
MALRTILFLVLVTLAVAGLFGSKTPEPSKFEQATETALQDQVFREKVRAHLQSIFDDKALHDLAQNALVKTLTGKDVADMELKDKMKLSLDTVQSQKGSAAFASLKEQAKINEAEKEVVNRVLEYHVHRVVEEILRKGKVSQEL